LNVNRLEIRERRDPLRERDALLDFLDPLRLRLRERAAAAVSAAGASESGSPALSPFSLAGDGEGDLLLAFSGNTESKLAASGLES